MSEAADQGTSGAPTSEAAAPASAQASAPAPSTAPADTPPAESLLGGEEQPAPKDGEGGEQKAEDPPPGAPESYEDFTMPDGVELNAEVATDFKAMAKELNLPQAKAQQVADLGVKLVQDIQAKQQAAIEQQVAGWIQSAKSDAEFGGDKLNANLAVANKALTELGSPELKQLLKETGLANHPEMIRMMWKAGQKIGEDTVDRGIAAPPKDDSAKALYTKSNMN